MFIVFSTTFDFHYIRNTSDFRYSKNTKNYFNVEAAEVFYNIVLTVVVAWCALAIFSGKNIATHGDTVIYYVFPHYCAIKLLKQNQE